MNSQYTNDICIELEDKRLDPINHIVIPTTSGSGAEATPFAALWDHKNKKKISITSEKMIPSEIILDHSLLLSLPENMTIITGLDALSHACESIWNKNMTSQSFAFAIDALEILIKRLPEARNSLDNNEFRKDMQIASFKSGCAIAITKTALAHSMSYPITAHIGIPHGLACSFTLPQLYEFNLGENDGRFDLVASRLNLRGVEELKYIIQDLLEEVKIKEKLHEYNAFTSDTIMPLTKYMLT